MEETHALGATIADGETAGSWGERPLGEYDPLGVCPKYARGDELEGGKRGFAF